MTTPRQPREESSRTAQIRESAEVSPGKRPITFVRLLDLDEGALEQVRAADPLAVLGREAQVADERLEVALDHGRRRGVGDAVVSDEGEQADARLCDRPGLVEDPPVARLQLAVQALGQLLQDVSERVHGAALLERARPELACRLPEPGGAVGDQERRRSQPARDQVAAEVEPVLVALARAEPKAEQGPSCPRA